MGEMVTVVGAGNGGCTVAAELAIKGHKVNLYEIPEFAERFEPIRQKGEIIISGKASNGIGKLNMATTNIKKATDDVKTIFVVVPSFGHKRMAELLVPVLTDGTLLILFPGAFGTITFLEEMKKQNLYSDITFAEGATIPYGTRLKSSNEVVVHITTLILPVGVFPAKRTDEAIRSLKEFYPETVPCHDILDAALNNLNPVTHPAPAILSTSAIENRDDFYLYRDGISDGVKRVMIAMDKERIKIREAWGLKSPHYGYHQFEPFEAFEDFFGKGGLVEAGYKMKGPSSMKDRYVTEDVPYGLVFYSTVARKVGIKTPAIDAIINLSSTINETDYWEIGADIGKLSIGSWSTEKLSQFLFEGE